MLKHIWKKDDFLYKTTTYFVSWRVVHRMESKYGDMVSVQRFAERKIGPRSIFVTASEHMWMCSTFGTNSQTDGLDEIYFCDEHTMVFMEFKDFYSCKRTSGVNINYFLIWYEFFNKNYVNLELPCQELKPFLFWMQQMYQKKTKS